MHLLPTDGLSLLLLEAALQVEETGKIGVLRSSYSQSERRQYGSR